MSVTLSKVSTFISDQKHKETQTKPIQTQHYHKKSKDTITGILTDNFLILYDLLVTMPSASSSWLFEKTTLAYATNSLYCG